MLTLGEFIGNNHPDYDKRGKLLLFLRISFEGEDCVKENAIEADLIRVPAGMTGYSGERSPVYHRVEAGKEANDYIHRARYPEVLQYSTAMATGKAWSRAPEIKGDAVREILDDLWADGSDFRTGVLKALEDYLVSGGGGFFVNLNAKNMAVISHHTPESVVNWNVGDKSLRLVVMENEEEGDNPFTHETVKTRFVAGIDNDSGQYFQEKWTFEPTGSGKDQKHAWTLSSDGRFFPTLQQDHMDMVPFFVIGDWHLRPIFKALAKTAAAYFRGSAEYNHLMYWGAMPTPLFKFTGDGGFWGVDEFDAAAVGDDGAGEYEPPTIKMGCTTPILLRDGDFDWSSAPTDGIGAQRQRLMDYREEIGGLGMRAFNNTTNANQTAETERLQQSGEGSLVHSAFREVAMAITLAVRHAAKWRGIADADSFSFEFDNSLMFGDFDLNDISGLSILAQEGIIARRHIRDALRQMRIIGPNETDEALDAEIAEERGIGSDFGGGADDFLDEDDFLAAGVDPDADEDDDV